MKIINEMKLIFDARSVNEGFSRAAVAAFAALLDPTVEELSDLRTAVSFMASLCASEIGRGMSSGVSSQA